MHPRMISFLMSLGVCLFTRLSIASSQCRVSSSPRRRLFVLTDIANEPDDAQSFVRMLLYAHEFDIQGIVATTSYWLNDTTRPDQLHDIVDAYAEVLPNLQVHADGWPSSDALHSLIKSGPSLYGMNGVGHGHDSEGSELLVKAADASSEPLWIPVWGGANVLAQALWHVNATRTPAEVDDFVSKLRVYAISDQDNSGAWIRRHWPQLFYIASVHHFNRYSLAGWLGISGDIYSPASFGVETELVSQGWLREHVQTVGPLGRKYPDTEFLMEGDTPSLLYLIPNGLSDPQHPEWGSWGGRFGPVNWGEGHFADSVDIILDAEGRRFADSKATIWRWRAAFQNDFRARMQWTVQSAFDQAAHAPVAVVNGSTTRDVLQWDVVPEQTVVLDASSSCDPDGNELAYKWWQYLEPSSNNNNPTRDVVVVTIDGAASSKAAVSIPSEAVVRKRGRGAHPHADKHVHIILEVTDGLQVSYRRIVLTIRGHSSNGITAGHTEL